MTVFATGWPRYGWESLALQYADGGDRVLDESWRVAPASITGSGSPPRPRPRVRRSRKRRVWRCAWASSTAGLRAR
jgi:hypothetical protein